ncbi:MAG: DUF5723 family protein [Prevotellaceae bacterium]|jgi:outer membrane protein OmpA-like peptidoglycan-associated protein|nr:DUF5723 family protein [Prevotellaceae bacterium]
MKKFFVTVAMACCSVNLFAQQVNTLYFMNNVPERNAYNPAFQPVHNVYIDLPLMPNFRFEVGNSSLGFSDAIFSQKINGVDSTITFLHPAAQGKKDDFYKRLSKTTRVYGDLTFNIIGFGFRVKQNYFTVDVSQKASMGMYVPRDLFKLALYGAGKGSGGYSDVFDLSRLGMQASLYTEIGLGYSRKIDDKLTVGGKLKYLIGQANINTDIEEFKLTTGADRWKISGSGTINASLPLVNIPFGADGMIDLANLNPDVNASSFSTSTIFSSNNGFGVDLGATYNILPELQLSAALIDLGFIRWRSNLTNASMGVNFDTEGIDYRPGDKLEDKMDTLLQKLEKEFVSSGSHNSYTTALSTRFNVGAEYSVVNNKIGFGLLSSTLYANRGLYTDLTVAANLRPCTWFSTSFTYSLLNGRLSNVGFGAQLRVMPFNMYLAIDRIPLTFASRETPIPTNLKSVNLQAGLVWVIGNPKRVGDDDGDGVKNKRDKCPNTPAGYAVDKYGCVIDSDGDGISDDIDKCPGTPFGVHVDSWGCSLDDDGDSVPNVKDKCPNTPAGVPVDTTGCPLDSDRDSVFDYRDSCPNTPAGVPVDTTGCPLNADGDGDGVPDYRDSCPNTPAGVPVDSIGCPLDTDGDGIANYIDSCPTIKGVASSYGCPEVPDTVKQIFEKALTEVGFQQGEAVITPSSYDILDQIAAVMTENAGYILLVYGHTDSTGVAEDNLLLSEKRANAVKEYIEQKGIAAGRIIAKGFGGAKPLAGNDTEEGKAKNRRIEFSVKFER